MCSKVQPNSDTTKHLANVTRCWFSRVARYVALVILSGGTCDWGSTINKHITIMKNMPISGCCFTFS